MSEMYEIDWHPAEPNDYTKTWETRSGDRIKYSDMSDKHLLNTYNMLGRRLIAFTNHCMAINEEMEPPQYFMDALESLEKELRNRGLM